MVKALVQNHFSGRQEPSKVWLCLQDPPLTWLKLLELHSNLRCVLAQSSFPSPLPIHMPVWRLALHTPARSPVPFTGIPQVTLCLSNSVWASAFLRATVIKPGIGRIGFCSRGLQYTTESSSSHVLFVSGHRSYPQFFRTYQMPCFFVYFILCSHENMGVYTSEKEEPIYSPVKSIGS